MVADECVRVAVVGCGRHARTTLHPLLHLAGLEPVAVCAAHLESASAVAAQWPGAIAFDGVRRMLDSARVDGAVVCLPLDAYADVVPLLLQAGVPVFVEKPGARNSASLLRLADQADAMQVALVVGYMKRYALAYGRALERVRSWPDGASSLHARWTVGAGYDTAETWVIDNLVHSLDLLRMFGGEVVSVSAEYASPGPRRHALALSMRHESGAVSTAQLATTGSWEGLIERLEVVGVGESVTVTNVDTFTWTTEDGVDTVQRPSYTVPLPQHTTPVTTGFLAELQHFAAVVATGATPLTPARDAARTLALAEKVLALIDC